MRPAVLRESIAHTLRLARTVAPAAVLASGLLVPSAWGKPGDLDPSFGDVGRAFPLPDLDGPAWSIQALDDDDFFFGGGIFYDSYYSWYYDDFAVGFTKRITPAGAIDQGYAGLKLTDTQVTDVAVQSDGKVVGVGRRLDGTQSVLAVFRLDPDGALDPGFGGDGTVDLGTGEDAGLGGTSVALDSDGRIVVAGFRGNGYGEVIVARFLADGSLDATFGTQGVFTGPIIDATAERPRILRTSDGRFRVTTTGWSPGSFASHCQVLGLTADGELDATFGIAGIADVGSAGPGSVTCGPLVQQPSGGLVVAGSKGSSGMLIRLVSSGTPDGTFAAPAVTSAMTDVTALGVASGGSLTVAGRGPSGVSGALVVRLLADGQLDTLFGNDGSTWIDLPFDFGATPIVHDLSVLTDGGVLLAGGAAEFYFGAPFAARLKGTGGSDGPGVLGIERPAISTTEQGQNAVVTVRRMGGDSGQVSVAFETRAGLATSEMQATPGADYTTVSGRLTWADGETADKQVTVPIAADAIIEGTEYFSVVISSPQGGAGLGTLRAHIEIPEEEGFLGRVRIEGNGNLVAREQDGSAPVRVWLEADNPDGVTVTLTTTPGTATPGTDYVADSIMVTWPAGTSGLQVVQIPLVDDDSEESQESFTVSLANPTNGVGFGNVATATVRIFDDDQRSSGGGGGGGWLGLASVLLLGVSLVWRRRLEPPMPLR